MWLFGTLIQWTWIQQCWHTDLHKFTSLSASLIRATIYFCSNILLKCCTFLTRVFVIWLLGSLPGVVQFILSNNTVEQLWFDSHSANLIPLFVHYSLFRLWQIRSKLWHRRMVTKDLGRFEVVCWRLGRGVEPAEKRPLSPAPPPRPATCLPLTLYKCTHRTPFSPLHQPIILPAGQASYVIWRVAPIVRRKAFSKMSKNKIKLAYSPSYQMLFQYFHLISAKTLKWCEQVSQIHLIHLLQLNGVPGGQG